MLLPLVVLCSCVQMESMNINESEQQQQQQSANILSDVVRNSTEGAANKPVVLMPVGDETQVSTFSLREGLKEQGWGGDMSMMPARASSWPMGVATSWRTSAGTRWEGEFISLDFEPAIPGGPFLLTC